MRRLAQNEAPEFAREWVLPQNRDVCAAEVRLDCAGSRKISRCGVVLSELSARAVLQ